MQQTSLTEMKWRRFDGRQITLPIQDAVQETILREKALGHRLKVCIGTDSQVRGKTVEFAKSSTKGASNYPWVLSRKKAA